MHTRLDLVLGNLRQQGYEVVEGACLRCQSKSASAASVNHAREFGDFLQDDSFAAVLPPWGGELASTILEHIDWSAVARARPKWILGFSDISTFQVPLLLHSGWVSVHGPNLMQLVPAQTDEITSAAFRLMTCQQRAAAFAQNSSERYEVAPPDIQANPEAPFCLSENTRWKRLDALDEEVTFSGRLVGGCLDSLCTLAGTAYGDIPGFRSRAGDDGTILFLEVAELSAPTLVRVLVSLKRHGWFDGLQGLVFGRSPANTPSEPAALSYVDALSEVVSDLPYPVLYDADIGHMAPQLSLMQGSLATISYRAGAASVLQHWL